MAYSANTKAQLMTVTAQLYNTACGKLIRGFSDYLPHATS